MAATPLKPVILATLLLCAPLTVVGAETTDYRIERSMEIEKRLSAAYRAKGPDYEPRTEHLLADGSPKYTNRLILEDSPYLLQHAHNPVDWHPWGEEAFERAKTEGKPVFLSIGYSTCHWCHVMERESFENEAIAKLLNEHFISIKVDRESHPDVDEVYMNAVLLMNGHGGWPMSSFLTPDGRPFYSGTYFPPANFTSVLEQIISLWSERRQDVLTQAERVAEAVESSNRHQQSAQTLEPQIAGKAVRIMLRNFDELQGGFSLAPKFPHEPWLYLLLSQAERHHDQEVLKALEVTLDAMARGGIHDQIGGGFHRYSTDNDWLVPHFEKMLYNQAHLARVYLLAWRLTGRDDFLRVARRTLDYVQREMTAPGGGFYSATDADSEGEEGAFFIWTPQQIAAALSPEETELALKLYAITEQGNFEGRNIPHLPTGLDDFAKDEQTDHARLIEQIDRINRKLHAVRERREHPLRDDKIITAWNGMMISAFAQAADLLDHAGYRRSAERAAEFLWAHNRESTGRLWRLHLDGQSSVAATQEDYAYLAEGLLHLYDLSGETRWLNRAKELTLAMLARFLDEAQGGFFLSEADADITAMSRPRDSATDNAIPSGSSVALRVLQRLWLRTGKPEYRNRANELIAALAGRIASEPYNHAYLITGLQDLREGELSQRGYAAQGGIRLAGSLKPLSDGKRLLQVRIEIPEGWHINADQPESKDLIATELTLGERAKGWKLGPVTYPKASRQQLAFQSVPLSVYTGAIRLEAIVETGSAEPLNFPLPVALRLQACNNEVCLPPEQLSLRIHHPE
jgi:uncharacterized protein YyaL (SSP411 family)